mgnify:CR=1 FL=1
MSDTESQGQLSSAEENDFADLTKKELSKQNKKKKYDNHVGQQYDDILSQLFERVEPGEGDEFAAVKPWLGAIKEPKGLAKPSKISKKAPVEDYEIDWVWGYRSEEARQNCSFNSLG